MPSFPHRMTASGVLLGLAISGVAAAHPWESGAHLWLDYTPDFEYRERGVMTQDGALAGVGGALVHSWPESQLRFRLAGDLRAGTTDYDGQTQDGRPTESEADDAVLRAEALLGWSLFEDAPAGNLLAFGGLGVRNWGQDLKDGRTEDGDRAGGYGRGHRYVYLPVGGHWSNDLSDRVGVHATASYQVLLRGRATADLSDIDPRLSDLSLPMNDGAGYRLAGGLSYALRVITLTSEIYYQRWDIEESDSRRSGGFEWIEPENSTDELGLRVGVYW